MIICDKCGASNENHRLICIDCGRELTSKEKKSNLPKRENPSLSGETSFNNADKMNYSNTKSIFCTTCGNANPYDGDYCYHCGKSLYDANIIKESKGDKLIKNFFISMAVILVIGVLLFVIIYCVTFFALLFDESPNDLKDGYNVASISTEDLLL